jgi:hypothetical protein
MYLDPVFFLQVMDTGQGTVCTFRRRELKNGDSRHSVAPLAIEFPIRSLRFTPTVPRRGQE